MIIPRQPVGTRPTCNLSPDCILEPGHRLGRAGCIDGSKLKLVKRDDTPFDFTKLAAGRIEIPRDQRFQMCDDLPGSY